MKLDYIENQIRCQLDQHSYAGFDERNQYFYIVYCNPLNNEFIKFDEIESIEHFIKNFNIREEFFRFVMKVKNLLDQKKDLTNKKILNIKDYTIH